MSWEERGFKYGGDLNVYTQNHVQLIKAWGCFALCLLPPSVPLCLHEMLMSVEHLDRKCTAVVQIWMQMTVHNGEICHWVPQQEKCCLSLLNIVCVCVHHLVLPLYSCAAAPLLLCVLTDLLIPTFSHILFTAKLCSGRWELYVNFSLIITVTVALCCFWNHMTPYGGPEWQWGGGTEQSAV